MNNCPLIIQHETMVSFEKLDSQIKLLESSSTLTKITALKNIISLGSTGAKIADSVIPIIKFCFSSPDKTIKRLCFLFFEIFLNNCPKDQFKDEMLLICNRLLQDLQHPNEYIKGATLRLLCVFQEPEILEMLKNSIVASLGHEKAYVRKNAVFALFVIFKTDPNLISDVCRTVFELGINEIDEITKRNCFLMLSSCDYNLAFKFLSIVCKNFSNESYLLLLSVIEFIRKYPKEEKISIVFRRILVSLLNSDSQKVVFNAADLLLTDSDLNSSLTDINQSFEALIEILNSIADDNEKIFLLNRLQFYKKFYSSHLYGFALDFSKGFSSDNFEIQKSSLSILKDLTNSENKLDVVRFLNSEFKRSDSTPYKSLILHTIFDCASKFSDLTNLVLPVALSAACQKSNGDTKSLVSYLKKVSTNENSRKDVVLMLTNNLENITNDALLQFVLSIITEKCSYDSDLVEKAFDTILRCLSYDSSAISKKGYLYTKVFEEKCGFLACNAATALSKLIYKFKVLDNAQKTENAIINGNNQNVAYNKKIANGLLCLTAILDTLEKDRPSFERVTFCLTLACMQLSEAQNAFSVEEKNFSENVNVMSQTDPKTVNKKVSEPFSLSLFSSSLNSKENGELGDNLKESNEFSSFVLPPKGNTQLLDNALSFSDKLTKVQQLSGYQDALYVEADFEISLDYTVVVHFFVHNRTDVTLNNVTLEIFLSGDLRANADSSRYCLQPKEILNITRNIKVLSSRGGIVFSTLLYNKSASKVAIIQLQNVIINVIDYIKPTTLETHEFTEMWSDYEWENKLMIRPKDQGLQAYVESLSRKIHMQILFSQEDLGEDSAEFLSANLVAKTIFDENVLMNVSLEKNAEGKTVGIIKIRSKKQEVAQLLGEKVNNVCC